MPCFSSIHGSKLCQSCMYVHVVLFIFHTKGLASANKSLSLAPTYPRANKEIRTYVSFYLPFRCWNELYLRDDAIRPTLRVQFGWWLTLTFPMLWTQFGWWLTATLPWEPVIRCLNLGLFLHHYCIWSLSYRHTVLFYSTLMWCLVIGWKKHCFCYLYAVA